MNNIFNVATYKRDEYLFKTIESIYDQADVINIALNSHVEIPTELNDSKINCFITDNSIGDGFKFYRLNESDGYFFTIDDDIIYPKEYSNYMIERYLKYNSEKIVTLHGRSFNSYPVVSYYRSPHYNYRCLGDLHMDVDVHFGGTGVMMFHTDLLKFDYSEIKYPNMADIWVAKFANEKGVKIKCIKHDSFFLKYQYDVGEETIFDKNKFNDDIQTRLTNTIIFN